MGGTSSASKLPDMLSLPPMAAMPRASWASSAPSSAAIGLPQRAGSLPSRSKYSWKVRWMLPGAKPAATNFETLSITAR